MLTPADRLRLASDALEGLSVGDAFGDQFFMHAHTARTLIQTRTLPDPPWAYTDDTQMALSIYATLAQHETIDQDALAASLAAHYDPGRGYGPAMHRLLRRLAANEPWASAARSLFDGQGSFGNGAAMRVAPLGAYFAGDLERVVSEAQRSALVTHAHPEGSAGAIAVAAAAAIAAQSRGTPPPRRADFLDAILPFVPTSEVKNGIKQARDLRTTQIDTVISLLGNGYRITAQDTVPFALWCAGAHLDNYTDALWLTASGLGDVDTNCAIVGGIVAAYTGADGIPPVWRARREPLPTWPFTSSPSA